MSFCKIEEQEARAMLEDLGADKDMIDNFISGLPKNEEEEEAQIKELKSRGIYIQSLENQYQIETNPFKKAAIAAKKISLGLE